jgi:predicted unusual protein kinase regulating ubiquinone biosynthesis (AarF/ABC1/UbiB family)
VLVEELGQRGADIFRNIQEKPIAAASLAQVHRA